ncbi:MAG: hypothetical protein LBM96_05795 [Methanobrevibacter sp.]|nr:hypothetical protein [Candidatus Methanoflexus mossambicus]
MNNIYKIICAISINKVLHENEANNFISEEEMRIINQCKLCVINNCQ